MPAIPGSRRSGIAPPRGGNPAAKLVISLLAVLLVVFLGARWALRPKHRTRRPSISNRKSKFLLPRPTRVRCSHTHRIESRHRGHDGNGQAVELKEFYVRNRLSGENIPAVLVRLPAGSPSQASGYWAFARNSPYGNGQLEYITDLGRLKSEYGFNGAKHPMVGNPCSRTVFDPLRMATLPGNFLVRGAIAQGSDLRPPLAVELKIQGKDILAVRTE